MESFCLGLFNLTIKHLIFSYTEFISTKLDVKVYVLWRLC